MPRYDIHAVKAAAQGHWDAIFSALAPTLAQAQDRPGQHVPCPVHGGTDGFRLFKHYAEKGDGICNTCGARTDGFDMLCWVNGWTFVQALTEVAKYLGLKPDNAHRPSEAPKAKAAGSVPPCSISVWSAAGAIRCFIGSMYPRCWNTAAITPFST